MSKRDMLRAIAHMLHTSSEDIVKTVYELSLAVTRGGDHHAQSSADR